MKTTRVRAIIVLDKKILLIHRTKGKEEYWVFPGGGVEETDLTLEAALARECFEELGVRVRVFEIYGIVDKGDGTQEAFYRCEILSGNIGTGQGPEFQSGTEYKGGYAIEWILLTEISAHDVKPESMKEELLRRGA